MASKNSRGWSRSVALIAATAALVLGYGVAKHLSSASPKPLDQQVFSVYASVDKQPWERPVIVIREGRPVHINFHSQQTGVLMVHEIPGAIAACASGKDQSLDILPVGITGRFSLHFHTQAGEQIEVATIEIYPKS
ncbi:hypothetical protein [Paraburkholderia sp.]|uniref:hypothetical protein n=1 Tax=Paraburkholderia sp. TaxID=1926495 RepID=UPI0039E5648A